MRANASRAAWCSRACSATRSAGVWPSAKADRTVPAGRIGEHEVHTGAQAGNAQVSGAHAADAIGRRSCIPTSMAGVGHRMGLDRQVGDADVGNAWAQPAGTAKRTQLAAPFAVLVADQPGRSVSHPNGGFCGQAHPAGRLPSNLRAPHRPGSDDAMPEALPSTADQPSTTTLRRRGQPCGGPGRPPQDNPETRRGAAGALGKVSGGQPPSDLRCREHAHVVFAEVRGNLRRTAS